MNDKTITCVKQLQHNEFASIITDDLMNDTIASAIATEKQIIGVFSPPSSGKTTLLRDVVKMTSDFGLHVVVVTPTVHLGNMINNVVNGTENFDGSKYTKIAERIIVTTPDGLANVLNMLQNNCLYFEIHCDEIHERIDAADTRPVFDNIDRAIESKFCVSATLYTGTADIVKHYYNFTKVYNVKKQGKRIKNNPKIVNLDEMSNAKIKDIVEYAYLNYRNEKGQVFAFLNDKTKHQYIDENLDTDIFNNSDLGNVNKSEILYISAKTKDQEHIKEMIRNKYIPEKYKIILITSSASAGIEFFLNSPATVLVFCNHYTFNIRQEVQSTIRVRTDIEELIFVKPEEKYKAKYIKYDKFYEDKKEKCMETLNSAIEFWEYIKNMKYLKNNPNKKETILKGIINNFEDYTDDDDDNGSTVALIYNKEADALEIKEALLHKYISDKYATLILNNTSNFIKCMKEQCTQFDFSGQVFEVLDYNELFKTDTLTEAIKDILNLGDIKPTKDKDKTKNKDDTKLIIEQAKKEISNYDMPIKDKISIVKNVDEALPSKSLHCKFYNNIEKLKNYDTTYKAIKELLILNSNEKFLLEYLEGATTYKINKYIKEERIKLQIQVAYVLIDNKSSTMTIKKQPKAVQKKIITLIFYENKKGSYKDVRVTNKSRRKLFEYMQTFGLYKNKTFTDEIDYELFTIICELFNISEKKTESIGKNKQNKVYKINSLKVKKIKQNKK